MRRKRKNFRLPKIDLSNIWSCNVLLYQHWKKVSNPIELVLCEQQKVEPISFVPVIWRWVPVYSTPDHRPTLASSISSPNLSSFASVCPDNTHWSQMYLDSSISGPPHLAHLETCFWHVSHDVSVATQRFRSPPLSRLDLTAKSRCRQSGWQKSGVDQHAQGSALSEQGLPTGLAR